MPNKKGKSTKGGSSSQPAVPDSGHIVFSNKPDGGKKGKGKSTTENNQIDNTNGKNQTSESTPRSDARKIIGGASWTGKLPVNLLSEHCQRQKWNKPDYSMRQMPSSDGTGRAYRSAVTISRTDPQTRETTTLPPFHLPKEHETLADCPTALEARHFAATYALFRVSSMKNVHMMLPPQYRDLWKREFGDLKEADIAAGHEWRYDADPFAAEAKRQEIHVAMDKRRKEEAEREARKSVIDTQLPVRGAEEARKWRYAPKLELGSKMRQKIDELLRKNVQWNPMKIKLPNKSKQDIIEQLTKYGFRKAHLQEAVEYCKDEEEVLEWLLVHVPEDDLPSWTLPPGYSAGISLVSGDLIRESKLKMLTTGGYASEICVHALRTTNGDVAAAAHVLQNDLIGIQAASTNSSTGDTQQDWQDEMDVLRAIFDERFSMDESKCSIALNLSALGAVEVHFFRPLEGYPAEQAPAILIQSESIPAYIRLSATRQVVTYARESLLGGHMIFSIVEWLEEHLSAIIENPGPLVPQQNGDADSPNIPKVARALNGNKQQRKLARFEPGDRRSDKEILQVWGQRQKSKAYHDILLQTQKLPAWSQQENVLSAIASQQVTLITGDTGSGKSTQSVQFILDQAFQLHRGARTKLVCTQPRRIAAISLCERVSAERCCSEGDEVGYIIRGESKISSKTKITFMTTGVLLRRIQSAASFKACMSDISHVLIDEVHERSLDTDFLLALLREHMHELPHVKLVLMSATVNADIFEAYFGGSKKVARVHIEGRTFPIKDYYLDDVLTLVNPFESSSSTPNTGLNHGDAAAAADGDDDDAESTSLSRGKMMQSMGRGINYSLITSLVQKLDANLGEGTGAILVFMPGVAEIERCVRSFSDDRHIHALPLHSSLLPAEQRRAFPPAPNGRRKVIIATNVAETSITIDDIVAVIDTGRVKETRYDASSNIVRLDETWASQASCKQRRGRAGRVREGACYKLFTRNLESTTAAAAAPEILRVPLEQLCLSVKATGYTNDVALFLAKTITPPGDTAVATAMKTLHRIGALDHNELTGLGNFLAAIPTDLRCAKLLVFASVFGCLDNALTIAAILSTRSPFVSPKDAREEAKAARIRFSVNDGDLLTDCAAFSQWSQMSSTLRGRSLRDWCSSNFLSEPVLRDIKSTRVQLLSALIETALVPASYSTSSNDHQALNTQNENYPLIRALIAGSLHPQIAEIRLPEQKYLQSMTGAKALDPEAKTIKYFNEENGRVFVHPSSILFDAQSFSGSAAYLSYFSKMATTKTFIRDLTPLNPYSLLLFGGRLEVDKTGLGVLVDGWLRLQGWAKIGVLASRLRALLDNELRQRIDNTCLPTDENGVFGIVRRLVEFNGQDR